MVITNKTVSMRSEVKFVKSFQETSEVSICFHKKEKKKKEE